MQCIRITNRFEAIHEFAPKEMVDTGLTDPRKIGSKIFRYNFGTFCSTN